MMEIKKCKKINYFLDKVDTMLEKCKNCSFANDENNDCFLFKKPAREIHNCGFHAPYGNLGAGACKF